MAQLEERKKLRSESVEESPYTGEDLVYPVEVSEAYHAL
jgi:hypothetical protein